MSAPDFSANVALPDRSRMSAGALAKVDRLRPDRMRAALGTVTIGREIVVLGEVGSTNDAIAELAKDDVPEGIVVFGEHQTAGRGQRGQSWVSTVGKALCFSVLLRPDIAIEHSARLTTWAANTVASTIASSYDLSATVKPPNDVYVHRRKVAGVLIEMKAQAQAPHLAILGIGINVNQAAVDFPIELQERAASLAIVTGRHCDRDELAIRLLQNLDRTYHDLFGH